MTLYLQVRIGAGRYLLDAAHVVDLRTGEQRASGRDQASATLPVVDLREILGAGMAAPGHRILYEQATGEPALLIVDRAEGLIDLADRELRSLPPIGPLGGLIDAISTQLVEERPMLRLRGERALHCSTEPMSSEAGRALIGAAAASKPETRAAGFTFVAADDGARACVATCAGPRRRPVIDK